jgi:hypothetical protein
MSPRWKFVPEFSAALMVPVLFLFLTQLGTDPNFAGLYATSAGAVFWAGVLWWRAQTPAPGTYPPQYSLSRLVAGVGLLALVAFVAESTVSAVVLGIAGVAIDAAHATSRAAEVRITVNAVFAIPIGMMAVFAIGFWAARVLPVRQHPLRWIAAVVVVWHGARLALYPVAASYATKAHVTLSGFGHTLLRAVLLGLLAFAVMGVGNILGRHRYGPAALSRAVSRPPPR